MKNEALELAKELIERNDIKECKISTKSNIVNVTGMINDLKISISIGITATSKRSVDDKVVDMYFNEELTQREIAHLLGISQGTVSRILKFYRYRKELEDIQNGRK